MGILTLGLLGVAAVFPVGGWYMQKADIADRGSAIAQSVMNDLVARGMLNPWAWYVATPNPLNNSTLTSPNYRFQTIDGKYTSVRTPIAGSFSRPFAETLREGLKLNPTNPAVLAKQFGHAYVIDPMHVAAATSNPGSGNINIVSYGFPATSYSVYPGLSSYYYSARAWESWRAAANERTWPIRRATFQQSSGWAVDASMADTMCRGSDDLTYDFPTRDDRPAIQAWDTANINSVQTPIARKWTGDYSWIASVVPTTNAARNGMAGNPEGFAYDVSVVVFYKRELAKAQPVSTTQAISASSGERMVGATVLSTGPNGGELLLRSLVNSSGGLLDNLGTSPFGNLKVGQWIMLCGPHPNSSLAEPRFVLKWYQVLSIDKEGAGVANYNPATQRVVAVRGPEWPWQPRASYPSGQQNSDVARLSDDLCVGIFRGAVAVHTKTLRLESPLGGAYGSGMSVMTPPGVTNQYIGY